MFESMKLPVSRSIKVDTVCVLYTIPFASPYIGIIFGF